MFEIIISVLIICLLVKALGWALKISWKALKAAAVIFLILAIFATVMCLVL